MPVNNLHFFSASSWRYGLQHQSLASTAYFVWLAARRLFSRWSSISPPKILPAKKSGKAKTFYLKVSFQKPKLGQKNEVSNLRLMFGLPLASNKSRVLEVHLSCFSAAAVLKPKNCFLLAAYKTLED